VNAFAAIAAPWSETLPAWTTPLHAFAEHWWAWVAPLSVQLAVLAVPLWLLDRLWARGGHARLRATLWGAVLLRALWPGDVGVLRLPSAEAPGVGSVASDLAGHANAAPLALATSATWPLLALAALWGVGALLGLALHARAARRARTDWGTAQRVHDAVLATELRALAARLGLARVPRARLHARLAHPLVDGVLRPTLRLPADFVVRHDALGREHVLLHELAHLRRRDPLRAAAQALLTQLLWFHPCVRLASSRLHVLREQRCDELAAAHARGGRVAYRRTLLETAAAALLPERARPGLALLGARAPLIERLERLGRAPSRAGWTAAPVLVSAALALLPLRDAAPPATPLADATLADVAPLADSVTPHHEAARPDPVPGAATGCFENRFRVMAALAQREADAAARVARTASRTAVPIDSDTLPSASLALETSP